MTLRTIGSWAVAVGLMALAAPTGAQHSDVRFHDPSMIDGTDYLDGEEIGS